MPGAEEYIFDCLEMDQGLNLMKARYMEGTMAHTAKVKEKGYTGQYAEQLIKDGHAYYAFDTPQELEKMRQEFKTEQNLRRNMITSFV